MTKSLLQQIEKQLSEMLDKEVVIADCKQVFGGDINSTYIISTQEEKYFLKQNGSAQADNMFKKEYSGLLLLCNKSLIKVPQPVLQGHFENDSYIVIECLERDSSSLKTWQKLGEGLAIIHRQTQPIFGLAEDNFIGTLHQVNTLTETWANFYTEYRILPLFKKAFDNHLCTNVDIISAERLCATFENLFPKEPPALVHGDLWSGNFMPCTHNEVAIYDPAVYYGHREMDIAMTLLFGGFHQLFYVHYNETYPLENGWQNRVDLCQLYPLLVHLNLFGSAYYSQVKNIVKRYA